MKRRALILIAILILSVAFISCKGGNQKSGEAESADGGNAKILKTINHGEGVSTEYEYNDKKHLVRLVTTDLDIYGERNNGEKVEDITTITYSGNDIVSISDPYLGILGFERKGNTIAIIGGEALSVILTLDGEGNVIKKVTSVESDEGSEVLYEYSAGNLVKVIEVYSFATIVNDYTYDDRKSLFNCNTPKWFMQYYHSPSSSRNEFGASKNNIIGVRNEYGETMYSYEYDDDDYPVAVEYNGYHWGFNEFKYFE